MKKGIKLHKKSLILLAITFTIWIVDCGIFTPVTAKSNDLVSNKIVNTDNSSESQVNNEFGFEKVYVSYVIDGDTIKLSTGEKVRLIGVNSPEDTSKKEVFGDIATSFVKDKIEGTYVYLEKDQTDKDKYGRLLRNVWIELPTEINETEMRTKCLNAILLTEGMAKSMTIAPNNTYGELYKSLSKEAKENRTGMWQLSENGTTSGDF